MLPFLTDYGENIAIQTTVSAHIHIFAYIYNDTVDAALHNTRGTTPGSSKGRTKAGQRVERKGRRAAMQANLANILSRDCWSIYYPNTGLSGTGLGKKETAQDDELKAGHLEHQIAGFPPQCQLSCNIIKFMSAKTVKRQLIMQHCGNKVTAL